MVKTFDNKGNQLGDDALPADLQSFVDESGDSSDTLPAITVTAAAEPALSFASLLSPPGIYVLFAAIALLAYMHYSDGE